MIMKVAMNPSQLDMMVDTPQDVTVLFVDTETTDNDQETCEIIDLALALFQYPKNQGLEHLCQRVRPHGEITPEASGVHNIILSDLQNYPTIEAVAADPTLLMMVNDADYVCSHNSDFDLPILKRLIPAFQKFDGVQTFDTMRMARRAWPELPDHKLASLRYRFQLLLNTPEERELGNHAADGDMWKCKALFDRLVEEAQCPVGESLVAWSQARIPVANITFGKHKGTAYAILAKTEPDYLRWLYEQDWLAAKFPSDYATIEGLLTVNGGDFMRET